MKTKTQSLSVFIVFMLAVTLFTSGQAHAATLCVDSTGAGGCSTTIQAAIDSASDNDTIHVAAGTYVEQLTVTKSIRLIGDGLSSSVIQAPPSLPAASNPSSAIIIISGNGVNAELSGLTVTGPGPSACGSIRAGIFVRDNANAYIHDNTIRDIRDSTFSGCQNGVAIAIGRQALSTSGTATIVSNTVVGYQKGAIVVDNIGSSATIMNNTVTGAGTTSVTAQNGIQVSRGATASLSGNLITGNSYFKAGDTTWSWGAAGVLLYQSGAVSMAGGNIISGNDQNIYKSNGSGMLTMGNETLGPSSAPAEIGSDIVNFDPLDIDATAVTFSGASDNFAIEDRIWHVIDEAGLGLVTWSPNNVYITLLSEGYQPGSIQRGITSVAVGGKVNVATGTFTENILLSKPVSVIGRGAANTVITNPSSGDASLGVIQVSGSGLSDDEPILLKDLTIQPMGRAGISVGKFTQSTGTNVSYLALENIDVVGTNLNPCTEQERGLYVDNTSSLQHLSIKNSSFNNLTYGWYIQKAVNSETSTVQYVTVEDTTFIHNNLKGIYAEKLEDATFTDIVVDGNGFGTAADLTACSYFQPWQSGVDINLKAGAYQNLRFVNPEITNNGLGAKEGVGLALKARDDGPTYGVFPATLHDVLVTNAIITENERGIRLGEPGKNNLGPTNVNIQFSNLAGNIKTYGGVDGSPYGGTVNQSPVLVNAETNWWGSKLATEIVTQTSGSVDYTPWLCSGLDTSPDPGFQPDSSTLCPYQFTGFSQPIDMSALNLAKAGQTIPVKWRLTDGNGTPIDNPSSFGGLFSYGTSCNNVDSLVPDSIETYSTSTGLQYLGDGYWQFNWKTAKSFSNSCRKMYILFDDSSTSIEVKFQFK